MLRFQKNSRCLFKGIILCFIHILETPARHCRAQLGGGQLPSPLEFFIYVVDALLL